MLHLISEKFWILVEIFTPVSKLKHHFLMLPVPKPCYFYAPQEILSKLEHHFLMLSVQKHCKYTLPQETELQVLAGLRPVKNNWTLDQTAIMHGKASLDGPNQPCMLAGSSDVLISCSYGKRHTVNSWIRPAGSLKKQWAKIEKFRKILIKPTFGR